MQKWITLIHLMQASVTDLSEENQNPSHIHILPVQNVAVLCV